MTTLRDAELLLAQKGVGPRVSFPVERTFHDLFFEQASRTPDAVAVSDGRAALSYEALAREARGVARALVRRGLRRGEPVGIVRPRDAEFLVAMLGIFAAGGAYVPVDPSYPRERAAFMLADAEVRFVLAEEAYFEAQTTLFAGLTRIVAEDGDAFEGPALTGEDRAYLLYTSGSTGKPKGAICRHNGALNHLFGELWGLGLAGPVSFLQTAPSSSDISVWQFLAPVLTGGRVVVVEPPTVIDPSLLFAAIRAAQVDLVELVPVSLRALVDHIAALPAHERALPHLKAMMATGDALAVEVARRWFTLFPTIPLANTYGPTEASDDITLHVMSETPPPSEASVPIGKPLPNLTIFILDAEGRPVPEGVAGELGVAGIGVGEGYFKRPEKTAEAFVPSPFPELEAGLMYRTGDLGRWRADGAIDFLGRIDHQVKVRGVRVELGEIEAALLLHSAVRDAVVLAVEGIAGARLVAHVVIAEGATTRGKDLLQALREVLPEALVPASIFVHKAFALTPAGKIDRDALRAHVGVDEALTSDLPEDATEAALVRIHRRVLGCEVGVDDDFFSVGGDSVLAVLIASEASKQGFLVSPAELLQQRTVAALAALARGRSGDAVLPDAADEEGPWPLTPTQREIYLRGILAPKGAKPYVEQVLFDLVGPLDGPRLATILSEIAADFPVIARAVSRHPTLSFRSAGAVAVPVTTIDLRGHEDRGAAIEAFLAADRALGFEPSLAPLTRFSLLRLQDERTRVVWTYHHLVLDGWSEPLVLRAVFTRYAGDTPSPSSASFAAHARALTATPRAAQIAFFRRAFALLSGPCHWPRSALAARGGGPSHDARSRDLDAAVSTAVGELSRRLHISTSSVFHAAFALLHAQVLGRSDVLFGTTVSGRAAGLAGSDTLVGPAMALLPVPVVLPESASVSAFLQGIHGLLMELLGAEHVPLAEALAQHDWGSTDGVPFDAIIDIASYPGRALTEALPAELSIEGLDYVTMPHHPLTLFVVPGVTTHLRLVFAKALFDASTVDAWLARLATIVEGIVARPDGALRELLR